MICILGKSRLKGHIDPSFQKYLSMFSCFNYFLYILLYFAALDNHILSRIRSFYCLRFHSQYLELEKVMEFISYFPIKKTQTTESKPISPLAVWRPHANRTENDHHWGKVKPARRNMLSNKEIRMQKKKIQNKTREWIFYNFFQLKQLKGCL